MESHDTNNDGSVNYLDIVEADHLNFMMEMCDFDDN